MTREKHLMMISFDAVGSQDIDILLTLPNFSSLCRRGTLVRDVSSIFVSNTYPTHTTIQTGVLPRTHGVMDNDIQDPLFKREKWRFHVSNIQARTLTDEAKKAGKTICTVLYPVTGGSKSIRYNFVEIAGHVPLLLRIGRMLKYGSTGYVLSSLFRFGHLMVSGTPEALDIFTASIACDTIRRKKPDLTMVHLLNADMQKHHFGPESPEAIESLHHLDDRLGDLLSSVEQAGLTDSTSIIIFSDHNCCPVHTSIMPNEFLLKAGLTFKDAFFHTSGGCCFLRLISPDKKDGLAAFVDHFLSEPFVDRVLTKEEMSDSGADKEFACGFSAAPGYCFGGFEAGQHGYTLDRDLYHTFYLAVGDLVPSGQVQSGGSLLNICPLAVDLLDIEPWPMDGKNFIFSSSRTNGI